MQSILMNSFCIGIVYTRLSRAIVTVSSPPHPQTRSRSIICSDKAVIRRIDGKWCFVFQICEMRKHQLIESHVTCYCVQKTVNKSSGVPFQMSRMALSVMPVSPPHLQHPKESRSGYTVMMLPAVIVSAPTLLTRRCTPSRRTRHSTPRWPCSAISPRPPRTSPPPPRAASRAASPPRTWTPVAWALARSVTRSGQWRTCRTWSACGPAPCAARCT